MGSSLAGLDFDDHFRVIVLEDEFACALMEPPGWEGSHSPLCSNSLYLREGTVGSTWTDGAGQCLPGHGRRETGFDRLIMSWSGSWWKIRFLILDTVPALASDTTAKFFLSWRQPVRQRKGVLCVPTLPIPEKAWSRVHGVLLTRASCLFFPWEAHLYLFLLKGSDRN